MSRESQERPALIDYTNHRGERSVRPILPIRIWHGFSEWHGPTQQWFLRAFDLQKNLTRDFAMTGIHEWSVVGGDQ